MNDQDEEPHSTRSIAITGASGFLGSALSQSLRRDGVRRVRLVRRAAHGPDEIAWSPAEGTIEAEKLEGLDAVVHLAAENIFGPWTPAKKRRILESRAKGTTLIADAVARLGRPPRVLVSASGVNYYGDRGDDIMTESEPPGDDFLAHVCVAWEAATASAEQAGIRVVHTRMGVVLHPSGGALALALPIFKLGLGGKLGSGRQWLTWVALDDAIRAIRFALDRPGLSGPVNVAAPNPVRSGDFSSAIAGAVNRPAFIPVPAFALKAVTGGLATNILLASTRAVPQKLLEHGFDFEHPGLAGALRHASDGNA